MLPELALRERARRQALERVSVRRAARRAAKTIVVLGLLAWTIAELLPIVATVLSAFKSNLDILISPMGLPHQIVWQNFAHAWGGPPFGMALWRYALNSAIAVTVGVVVAITVGSLAGYALARGSGRVQLFNRYFIILLTIPAVVTWVPLFSLLSALNLLSNRFALGLVYAAFTTPLVTVLMRSYFASFPLDLIEAAKIDGASETQAFVRIVLPSSIGMMSVVSLIQAIWLWNELALAVILLLNPNSETLPVGLLQFKGQFLASYGYGAQYAALLFAILPIIAVYVFTQRRVTEGMRLGALR